MKVPVRAVLFLLGIFFTVMVFMAITSNGVRLNESEQALAAAVEQTLKQSLNTKGYQIQNYDELIADFNQNLILQINSDSELEVSVFAVDLEKGVLDIQVAEKYKTITGRSKEVKCRKTVILEHYTEEKNYCVVTFYVDDRVYEKYSVYQGSKITMPENPIKDGHLFQYWKLHEANEPVNMEDYIVMNDAEFSAVFD